ncbi:MAG TPA: GIY-YIG nuclease family protein [Bacteroidota bacterium]|nr:GIY-YIG nuclease family protein [Bacteroidota bacterium]
MFWVYVLRSLKDGKHYTGYTNDFDRRFHEHNTGRTHSTRRRRPFILVHLEEYSDEESAKKREKHLKSGRGREELREILKEKK